ncbi:putative thioredoxin-like protein [Lupinus albus]|uniref:Putative thioredoxin-like protein n=1 Tax=Lupinus albus TaxID=3870 RepID=A0A6A4NDS7_LUPAL|nr:putative thioredoxin-like protein [Lupinus albus]
MSRFSFFNRSNTFHLTPLESSPQKPYSLERTSSLDKFYDSIESVKSTKSSIRGRMVKKFCNLFETKSKDSSKSFKFAPSSPDESCPSSRVKSNLSNSKGSDSSNTLFMLPDAEDRIVVYFTSLRGIRRTFEDCNAVRMILKGFRVWVDERDVSMDIEYRKELQRVMKEEKVSLPQVFIRGKYIGGADMIKHLFEYGELGKLLEGFPKTKPGGFVCEGCGDMRFVPCFDCSGSRKVFDEDEGLLKRCLECNENGLIRCVDCCY